MRLGTVDNDTSTVIYPNYSIDECRAFLMEHKLRVTYNGEWIGKNVEGTILWCGNDFGWTAAYWYTKQPQNKKVVEGIAKQRKV